MRGCLICGKRMDKMVDEPVHYVYLCSKCGTSYFRNWYHYPPPEEDMKEEETFNPSKR